MNNDENLVFNEGNSINIETNNPNVTIKKSCHAGRREF